MGWLISIAMVLILASAFALSMAAIFLLFRDISAYMMERSDRIIEELDDDQDE